MNKNSVIETNNNQKIENYIVKYLDELKMRLGVDDALLFKILNKIAQKYRPKKTSKNLWDVLKSKL